MMVLSPNVLLKSCMRHRMHPPVVVSTSVSSRAHRATISLAPPTVPPPAGCAAALALAAAMRGLSQLPQNQSPLGTLLNLRGEARESKIGSVNCLSFLLRNRAEGGGTYESASGTFAR